MRLCRAGQPKANATASSVGAHPILAGRNADADHAQPDIVRLARVPRGGCRVGAKSPRYLQWLYATSDSIESD
jgi:hypothetical protein